jgi:hypothetical protein
VPSALKVIARIALFIVLLVVLSFAAYDFASYQPRKSDINNLLLVASQDEKNPQLIVSQFAKETVNGKVSWQATRLIIETLGINNSGTTLEKHIKSLLWYSLVSIHLTEQEQMTVFLSQAYIGIDKRGFSAASEYIFQKPLSSLSAVEAATLAIITKAPSYYAKHPERLEQSRNELLSRKGNGS